MQVAVRHVGGEVRYLTVVGGGSEVEKTTRVHLAWPLFEYVQFSRATGWGYGPCKLWRMVAPLDGDPPFAARKVRPPKPKVPKLNDAQKRTLGMFADA